MSKKNQYPETIKAFSSMPRVWYYEISPEECMFTFKTGIKTGAINEFKLKKEIESILL